MCLGCVEVRLGMRLYMWFESDSLFRFKFGLMFELFPWLGLELGIGLE